jgi:GDP-L-fucose synthase
MSLIAESDRIAIFGARGMAGSAIARALQQRGYESLLTPGRDALDCLDRSAVEQWMQQSRPDVVVLAAARVGGIQANNSFPADFLLDNLKIQTNVIEAAWASGARRLLFLGSSCIYPKFAPQPIKEEYLLTDTLETTNEFYALAKISGIKLCQALKKQHNFNSICLMPTNLYGPGDNYNLKNSHVIPALIRKFYDATENNLDQVECWGSGSPFREFLYVDDLAEACIFILEKWNNSDFKKIDSKGEEIHLLNVGSPFETSIKDLTEIISREVGFKGEIVWDKNMPDGTPRKKLDTTKINDLGWKANTNLEKGIKLTLKHFKNEILNSRLRDF